MEIRKQPGLTFDDTLLEPGYTDFTREEVSVATKLTRNIDLALPLISSPMDTVTESGLAIALGRLGGIGIIHRNLTVLEQAAQVEKVKQEGVLVGAAVGTKPGFKERADSLVDAGVDVIVVDSAHGYSAFVIGAIRAIKARHTIDIIGGNIANKKAAKVLSEAGADGLRIGVGPGAICSTRVVSGMGVPQLSAIERTAKATRKGGVPVIADGGINYSGDVTKALAAGASSVMLGRLFAGSEEACGEDVWLKPEEVPSRFKSILNGAEIYHFKRYQGMGSRKAMETGQAVNSEEEFHGKSYSADSVLVAEGVEGIVPYSGPLDKVVAQLIGGLVSGLYYTGNRTIKELWKNARFQQVTQASLAESHPHDLFITDSGGNYLP